MSAACCAFCWQILSCKHFFWISPFVLFCASIMPLYVQRMSMTCFLFCVTHSDRLADIKIYSSSPPPCFAEFFIICSVSSSFNQDWQFFCIKLSLIFLPPFIVLYRLHNGTSAFTPHKVLIIIIFLSYGEIHLIIHNTIR